MKPLDKHYLSLQFKNQIHSKNAAEFQSFFENIMEKAFSDFTKIRPYGNMGDGGNDGYRKDLGIYYQVYGPKTPQISENDAAKKLQRDFQRLKSEWSEISNIKEYYFVFNDKYYGSVQILEEKITKLQVDNPIIKFELFLAKDLENVFFRLRESDFIDLGFNVDQRQAISNAYTYLESVKTEFDMENVSSGWKLLENAKDIFFALNDENLSLEYEILDCRHLQKIENINGAKAKYESIAKRYPKDLRPLLYLAEIYLNDNDFEKNNELLERAKKLNEEFWLLKLERALRQNHLREFIEINEINENLFPEDGHIKSTLYRVYGLILEDLGEHQRADNFIERAIHLNPDRFSNYVAKLALTEIRLLLAQDEATRLQLSQNLIKEIENIKERFLKNGDVGARNRAILNSKKLIAFSVQENISGFENLAKETFELLLTCYFDKQIERMLEEILNQVSLPINDLRRLLTYLKNSSNKISRSFSRALIVQFNLWNIIFTEGLKFFEDIGSVQNIDFIHELENKNYKNIMSVFKEDVWFAISFVNTLKGLPDLRRKIIEELPDDKNIQKEKLRLLLNFDENDYDEAFQILKQLDLSSLNYIESRSMLRLAQQKQAWDFEILILQRLLEKEDSKRNIFNLKIQLFNAYLNSKNFLFAIAIGEELLKEDVAENFYNPRRQDALLWNTIYACLERGKVSTDVFPRAKNILDFYQLANPSLEFKTRIEAELFLSNNEPEIALTKIIEGVKIKRLLSSREYAGLYFVFVRLGNQIKELNTNSLSQIQENTFVKLTGKEQWYFIGDQDELDASIISKTSKKHLLFIDKKLGDKIIFENKYKSEIFEGKVEFILTIEKYILWQAVQNFQKLATDGDIEGVDMVELPEKGDTIDPQYLLKFMEDMNKRSEPFYELYCQNNVPLAMLAVNEGGLIGAIGRIQNESKGFINFSSGTPDELEKQKEIARKVIDEGLQFYIDGTSALFLSEKGMLQNIYPHVQNLKVPQSVIYLLAQIANRFRYEPGQTGDTMGYSKGKITLSSIKKEERELLQTNFRSSIKILEANPKNIAVISSANKFECFSELEVPDELSDACILARKENIPVLTEDFLYLKMNEFETGKKHPEYFSSWALVRVLYEKGKINFNEYLDYFSYLSFYRFRFLSLNPDDFEKTVFSSQEEISITPENIRKLNLKLTLSEEYGVSMQDALRVVGVFFFGKILDDSVTLDDIGKIFTEISQSSPIKTGKREFGERLLGICITTFEKHTQSHLCKLEDKLKYQKFGKLSEIVQEIEDGFSPILN